MKKTVIISLFLSLLFAQCVPSIHPIYTEKDLTTDDRVLGSWVEIGGTDIWTFSKTAEQGGKSYQLILQQADGQQFSFIAHLVQLGKETYLDFYPAQFVKDSGQNYFAETMYLNSWLGLHSFARIRLQDNGIGIQLFNYEWFEEMIKERKIRIKHERIGNDFGLVLTASTAALQQFITKYAKEEKAYLEEAKLERKL